MHGNHLGGQGRFQADKATLVLVMADAPCSWAITWRPRVRMRRIKQGNVSCGKIVHTGNVEAVGRRVHVCSAVIVMVVDDVAWLWLQTKKR